MRAEFNLWEYLKTISQTISGLPILSLPLQEEKCKAVLPLSSAAQGSMPSCNNLRTKKKPKVKMCFIFFYRVDKGRLHFLPVSMSLPLAASLNLFTAEWRAEGVKRNDNKSTVLEIHISGYGKMFCIINRASVIGLHINGSMFQFKQQLHTILYSVYRRYCIEIKLVMQPSSVFLINF